MPSLRVPASDKAIKQNWCCTVVSIRANMYTVAPSLGQSLPGPSLEKVGVWPPSVVRPLGVQGQCMEGKSHSYVLSGFGDHLLRMTPNPCPKPTALPTLGPRQLGPSWMLPPACPIGPPSEFLGLTSLLLPPWPGAAFCIPSLELGPTCSLIRTTSHKFYHYLYLCLSPPIGQGLLETIVGPDTSQLPQCLERARCQGHATNL